MKKVILICLIFFLNSCGYSSIYKNQKSQDFQLNVIEMIGDNELNNLLKNELKLYSNANSNKQYDVSLNSKYEKITVSKNSSGVATDYRILVNTKINIKLNNNIHNLKFIESINIKNNSDSFEQNKYERNIKSNFASLIREKLIIKIFNLNDN